MTTTMATAPATPVRTRSTASRVGWLATAVAAAALAGAQVRSEEAAVWIPIFFGFAPDLSFLAALGRPMEHGRLAPRAVPLYNLVHRVSWPAGLLAAGALGVTPRWSAAAGLGWLAHISLDRAAGYGLRTPDGWQRG